jgi:4-diphosphocytidyl-2C-methyl-D-erythritol kinase
MTKINLFDTLTFTDSNAFEIKSNTPGLPVDDTNTIFKAIKALKNVRRINGDVSVNLEKKIPVGAGLGGGSSDGACTLTGICKLWALDISKEEMAKLGASIGSDVPFFFCDSLARCTGRGEVVKSLDFDTKLYFILVYPGFPVSTREIYKSLRLQNKDDRNPDMLLTGLGASDISLISKGIFNRLEKVVLDKFPAIRDIFDKMEDMNFLKVFVSGSGSTVVGLCRDEKSSGKLSESVKAKLDSRCNVIMCSSICCLGALSSRT